MASNKEEPTNVRGGYQTTIDKKGKVTLSTPHGVVIFPDPHSAPQIVVFRPKIV